MYTKSDLFQGGQDTLSLVRDDPSHIPELNLFSPMGNRAIARPWGGIEEKIEFLCSVSREPGVARVV